MPPVRYLFAATDLSPASLPAVDRGFQIAAATGARYTVMHALGLDALGPLANLLGAKAPEVAHKALARQHAALQAVTSDPARHQGVAAEVLVTEGMASTAVPEQAARASADLVVIGPKGQSTLRHLVIGSTASRLLRKSRCTVLVVKNPGQTPYRRALIPVDFSPGSEQCIRLARAIAPQAHIVLLHVFDVPFEGMLEYAGVSQDEIHRYRAEARVRALAQLRDLAARAGLADGGCITCVEHGDAVQHILAQEDRTQCDLLVMGKHGTHVTEELLLGSVTHRVLAESRSDMLVVVDPQGPASTRD